MISEANIVLFTGASERNFEETESSSIPKTDTLDGAKKSKANSMIEKVWGGGGFYNPQMMLYRDFVVLTAHVVAKQRQEIARKIAEKDSKQEVAVSEPEVTVSKPVSEPEFKVSEPEVSNEGEVRASPPEVTVFEPEITVSEPEVIVSELEVTVSKLEVTVSEPDVRASEPKITVSEPKTSAEEEKEDLNYFRFVDAFSGTGVLGIRIAKSLQNTISCEGTEFKVLVHSNDISPVCYELIRKNARVNLAPLLPNKGIFFKRTNQDVNVLLHTIAAGGSFPEQGTIREIPWQANKKNIHTVCL